MITLTPHIPDARGGKHSVYRDWESYSEDNIGQSGALHYAAHPTTVPLLVCYAVDDGPVQHYRPGNGEPIPEVFFIAANDPDWTVVAHNNLFDSALEIYQAAPRFGWPLVPIERQVCTMALAQSHGFPGALEKIADRLKLSLRKDAAGKKLMQRITKPQRRSDGTLGYVEPTPDEWERFITYCRIDVGLVREVQRHFKPLPEIEQRLYQLDHKINHRGPTIDVPLAVQSGELVKVEKANINARLCKITDGAVMAVTKVDAIREFVSARGHDMATLDKRAVAAVLAANPDPVVREVLELRQAGANSATAKYAAVLKCVGPDQRIRGLLRIYGAITGRWTSARFNLHNLVREDSKTAQAEVEAIRSGDLEQVRKFGPPLDVIARAVRGLVIAPDGKLLAIGDYSMIEPRLISWYSEEGWRLENFRKFDRTGDKLLDDYRVLGARMGGCPVDPTDEKARQRGKTATMAFGYGGSVGTWRKLVPNERRSDEEIRQEVNRFREIYSAHTAFMLALERQALYCAASREPVVSKRHSFTMEGDTLLLHLASGRALSYPNARIEIGKYGKPVVVYHDPSGDTEQLWYGALMAHLVSGTARDLLAHSLLNLDAAGFEIVLHVHDEAVAQADAEKVDLKLFERCMLDAPDWAAGLPLAIKVRAGDRYIKANTPSDAQSDALVEGDASIDVAEVASTGKPELAPKPAPVAPTSPSAVAAPADKHNGADIRNQRPAQSSIALPAFDVHEVTTIDLAELIDEPVPNSRKICCRFHDEATPSLHIYPDHYFCFGCHAYGDHIDWLMQVEGLDHTAAQEVLSNWTGPVITQSAAAALALEKIEQAEENRAYALTWWGAAKSIRGALAARYLTETRGIDLDLLPDNVDDVLRFHERCVFGPGTRHPCLLALMRDACGDTPSGIQRIALAPDARKIGRRMLGTAGMVKLWPAGKQLAIGEGLETVLAAATRLPYRDAPLRPAWAALSDRGMRQFPIIAGVERLILLADNDANNAGQIAAEACKRRWLEAGRRVVLLTPDRPDTDFNDVVLANLERTS